MLTYLSKRGATYYFRRVIPEELRPAFGGKRELTYSLKVKDRKEAARLVRLEAVKTDAEFKRASEVLAVASASRSEAGVENVREQALSKEHDTEGIRQYAALIAASFRRELEEAAREGRLEAQRENLQSELAKHEWNLKDGSLIDRFSLSTSESMVLGLRAVLGGAGGADLPPVKLPVRSHQSAAPTMSGLIDPWAVERQPTAQSITMWRRSVAILDEVCGAIPVDAITKKHVLAFKDRLVSDGVSPATVESRLNHIRSLFRFAIGRDYISTDPSAGVSAPIRVVGERPRGPWPTDALNVLFSSPVYRDGFRPLGGGGAAAYWLPLMGLFTGARLNELGQLRPKDIQEEDFAHARGGSKAWVIKIVIDKADGLSLKRASCQRRIPVPQALIELGFIEFVTKAKQARQVRIFPDLVPDRQGKVTGNWSKWFSRYIRTECKIADPKITYHSFRHSFKDIARAVGISEPVHDAITGHSDGREARKYGLLEYPLAPQVEEMGKFKVFGLKLPDPYDL